jgi:hypothetical protein
MKSSPTLFPSLCAETALADLQVRQTLAMGLVPLGLTLLLMAARAPAHPSPGLWCGAIASLVGQLLVWGLWRRSRRGHVSVYSTIHFLVRYLFVVLCPAMLWVVFGATILEMAGIWPPILLGLLLLVFPVSRILRERVGPDPMQAPHVEMAHIVCQQIEMVLGTFSFMGLISGAVLDANKDYPTDPTPLLIIFWMLALIAVLIGAVLGATHWVRLYAKPKPPQPLDDEPPPAAEPKPSLRFGSERF